MKTQTEFSLSAALIALMSLTLPVAGRADNDDLRIPRYSCTLNRSETLKVYEIRTSSGRREVGVAVEHFLKGETEKLRLGRPEIIEYDGTYLVLENRGRSGYLLLRFEDHQSTTGATGEAMGLLDNKLFNPSGSGGPLTGFQTLSHCRKL